MFNFSSSSSSSSFDDDDDGGGGGGGGGGEEYACPLYGLPGRTDLVDTLLISTGAGRSARHWALRSVALVAAGED